MYYEIHKLDRDDYSVSRISEHLSINRRTVKKYLAMSEQEYEAFLINQSDRKKELLVYESFVKNRLMLYRDTSAAQMHDWLKEHHVDFPDVHAKTVFNFVHWVRNKYNLPITPKIREYEVVAELPYGKQAQVDFGEYSLRTSSHSRVKVFFFAMTLSRSRYKFVWFTTRNFTTQLAIAAHELAFEYFGGLVEEIVYDQDKVLLVSENKGDLILTDLFRAYVKEQGFKVYFCRKADPESKGKVENVIKYVKINFLYNRTYHNEETLNEEVRGWMGRTANALPHGMTKKVPFSEWTQEQPFLKSHILYDIQVPALTYTVRKDNTISWKGNLYSLPFGTYTGRGCQVAVIVQQDELLIQDLKNNHPLCCHKIGVGRGVKIINRDHQRDKSLALEEIMLRLCNKFENVTAAKDWIASIRVEKNRYTKDQLGIIEQVIDQRPAAVFNKAMIFCHQNKILSASDFKAIVEQELRQPQREDPPEILLNPLSGSTSQPLEPPEKSSIDDYQRLLTK
jgi:transposase